MKYFLFDIGGTKMRFAVTDDCVECTEPVIVKTPETYEESLELISQTVRELISDHDVQQAFGGVAGTLNKTCDTLVQSPNNPAWEGKNVKADLEQAISVPVMLENDTAVIALGEATYGAGKGADIVAYMTVSTGVGGSRVAYGKLDSKAWSFEPGHQIIKMLEGGDLSEGTLENLVSGTAMKKRFGKEGYEITDPEIWTQVAKELAVGIHNTLLHWSPDVLVLGGSMITGDPCISFDELCEEVHKLSPKLFASCRIKKAELGDINGIHGALAWAQQIHEA